MLAPLVAAIDHDPRRQVGDPHSAFGLVLMLAAGAAGTERVAPQLVGSDLELTIRVHAPAQSIEEGVARLMANLDYWRDAPVWTPDRIADATQDWFKYIKA